MLEQCDVDKEVDRLTDIIRSSIQDAVGKPFSSEHITKAASAAIRDALDLAALAAFRAEEERWEMTEFQSTNGKHRIFQVSRSGDRGARFYKHSEALAYLNDASLAAAIMAAVRVMLTEIPIAIFNKSSK